MRKIVVAAMSTISGLVLLFSYHTSTDSTARTTTGSGTGTESPSGAGTTPNAGAATTTPSSTASPSSQASSGSSSRSTSSGTYTGAAVDTRWGTVQVRITVADGKITAADAIQYPTENPKDQQINAYAIPQLNAEVVNAQSAQIDSVSGATVTSDGYLESLQSAIDQAHLS
jgi:uncharacterized protein with FMN-binding domain